MAALAAPAHAQPPAIERLHHELDVRLEPARGTLHVLDRIEVRGRGSVPVRLPEALRLLQARVDDADLPAPHVAQGQRAWSVELAAGRTQRLLFEYTAQLPAPEQTDHRGTLRGLQPASGPGGAYLPAGTGWYPLVDEAPFSYRVRLELPAGQRGLVPGRLVNEEQSAQAHRSVFEFLHPAEGIDLMAGPYAVRERTHVAGASSVRLRTWFHPEIDDLAPGYLDALGGYLDLYSKWIGAYPFTEFSVVSSALPTGFGMPTLTYLGVEVLRLPFIRATSLGHEVLHNWWGNGVYVDYATGNWSEGLTTFMADYAYREREGEAAAREMRQAWLRDFAAIPDGEATPLRAFTARTHGTSQIVGYHKAAFVFLMLRDRLGAERFDAGLQRFWQTRRFQRAGWGDLEQAFEAASGDTLDAFFRQWLERAGAPDIQVDAADVEGDGTGYRVHVTLVQSAEPYTVAVPLALDTAAGMQIATVQLEHGRQSFVLKTNALPRTVRLDPELRVFRRLDARELPPILRQVMLDRDTRVQLALDPAQQEAGIALARALLDHPPALGSGEAGKPRLIIGTHAAIDAALARAGLPPRPAALAGRGSAQVWTAYAGDGRAIAVISAQDLAALQALARPLPHYGRQSWLVFDGAKAVDRGVWPGQAPEVPLTPR